MYFLFLGQIQKSYNPEIFIFKTLLEDKKLFSIIFHKSVIFAVLCFSGVKFLSDWRQGNLNCDENSNNKE